ncbi:hypothetical protein E1091_14895, partial [Micromonospora fluostatini]
MTSPKEPQDLVDGLTERPYLFVEHHLEPGQATLYRHHPGDHRTLVVIGGRVRVESCHPTGVSHREFGYLQGWHALAGATYRFAQVGVEPALVVE